MTYDIEDPTTYPPVGAYMWHLHHEIIGEPLTVQLQNRLDYIRTEKPEHERELRLRLIAPITAAVPKDVVKARAAYDKAGAARVKARDACDKAWAARDKAWDAYVKARAAYVKAGDAYDKARAARVKAWAARDKAWDAYVKAGAARDKARDAYVKAWDACAKAGAAYDKARDAWLTSIHATDCPAAVAGTCPWNGRSIFR